MSWEITATAAICLGLLAALLLMLLANRWSAPGASAQLPPEPPSFTSPIGRVSAKAIAQQEDATRRFIESLREGKPGAAIPEQTGHEH